MVFQLLVNCANELTGLVTMTELRCAREASSDWWVILPWRLGTLHEFTGTLAFRRNSGSGHERATDAGL